MTTGSCGHVLPNDWMNEPRHATITKARSFDGQKALSYGTDCLKCRNNYLHAGVLFETQEAADAWLAEPWKQEEWVR